MEEKLSMWRMRELSCTGKVLIIKSVILPIMLYVSVIFPPPDDWVRKMTRLLFLFFWGGRMEKCAREKITKPRAKGGFGLPKIGDAALLGDVDKDPKRQRNREGDDAVPWRKIVYKMGTL